MLHRQIALGSVATTLALLGTRLVVADVQPVFSVKIASLRQRVISCEPLPIAIEIGNPSSTTIETDDSPINMITVWARQRGRLFEDLEWDSGCGIGTEPFKLASGQCERAIAVLFDDERQNRGGHFIFEQAGDYEIKVKIGEAESNTLSIIVIEHTDDDLREPVQPSTFSANRRPEPLVAR